MARLRKRNYGKIITRAFFLTLLVGITFVFARGAIRMYARYAEASAGNKAAEAQLQELEQRKASLKSDSDRLSSSRGLEEELRKRYGVALPGEGVIELTAAVGASASKEKPTMVGRFLNWLF